jgi:predicted O-methyltransferase YrrM
VEALVGSDHVLKKGGLIVVDNVLWKGLVLGACTGDFSSMLHEKEGDSDDSSSSSDDGAIRKNRRARKLATKMDKFNSQIIKDKRVEVIVMPMRDGLSVIRKR